MNTTPELCFRRILTHTIPVPRYRHKGQPCRSGLSSLFVGHYLLFPQRLKTTSYGVSCCYWGYLPFLLRWDQQKVPVGKGADWQALFSSQVDLLVACFPPWNYPHLSSPFTQSPPCPRGSVQAPLPLQNLSRLNHSTETSLISAFL